MALQERVFIKQSMESYLPSCEAPDVFKSNTEYSTKSVEFSHVMRINGNKLYQKSACDHQQMQEIFKYYTKSIAYAPPDSEVLAFAYGNRSALLHRIGKYKESILDIDRALKIDKCKMSLKEKLLRRKNECLAVQGSTDSKKVYRKVTDLPSKIVDETNNNSFIQEKLIKPEEALCKFENLNTISTDEKPEHIKILLEKETENSLNSVTMKYNKKLDRHLVANRDIKPGEIIFVEKPYVSSFNRNSFHNYCGHCFMKSWTTIPCDVCYWCMFCSEKCKNDAWMSYHSIECSAMSYLLSSENSNYKIDYLDHLSLRSLLMGIKESGSIANFKADIQSTDKWIVRSKKDFYMNEIFESTGFKSIYTLHSDVPSSVMRDYALKSVVILMSLLKFTSLFENNLKTKPLRDLTQIEDVVFIGSVLLKLRIQSRKSSCEMLKSTDLTAHKIIDCYTNKNDNQIGACIPVLTFFIKHSCNPNTEKCITNGKVVVYAIQPIKKDTKLFINRQQKFFQSERSLRQSMIRNSMNFICECEACDKNWPTLVEMYKYPKQHPLSYVRDFNKKESDLFDENNSLVSPIINNHKKAQFNQATIRRLSQAMEKALMNLKQPSIVICELMICLEIVFERLYSSA